MRGQMARACRSLGTTVYGCRTRAEGSGKRAPGSALDVWTLPGALPFHPFEQESISTQLCLLLCLMRQLTSNTAPFPPCPEPPEYPTYVIRPDENIVPTRCYGAPRADICEAVFTANFHLARFPLAHVRILQRSAAMLLLSNLCCTAKHDVMEANYISQLSETDVQYNPVSANRHTFKQE